MPPTARSPILSQPLPLHPQLKIIETPLTSEKSGPGHVEYRIYNYRYLPSGRLIRGDGWGSSWAFALLCLILATRNGYLARCLGERGIWELGFITCLGGVGLLVVKSRTVVYQSVIPLPDLGLQLSTTRGISIPYPRLAHQRRCRHAPPRFIFSVSTSSSFIPLSEISTIIINEGIRRWSVVYYLAIIKKQGQGVVVALDKMTVPHAVLREVYHGVRERLFDEYDCNEINDAFQPE